MKKFIFILILTLGLSHCTMIEFAAFEVVGGTYLFFKERNKNDN